MEPNSIDYKVKDALSLHLASKYSYAILQMWNQGANRVLVRTRDYAMQRAWGLTGAQWAWHYHGIRRQPLE